MADSCQIHAKIHTEKSTLSVNFCQWFILCHEEQLEDGAFYANEEK
jgi:hypothetical protein